MWATSQKVESVLVFHVCFSVQEEDVAVTWGMERNLHLGHFEASASDCQVRILQNAYEGVIDSLPAGQGGGGKLSLIVCKRLKAEMIKAKLLWRDSTLKKKSCLFIAPVCSYGLNVWSLQEQRIWANGLNINEWRTEHLTVIINCALHHRLSCSTQMHWKWENRKIIICNQNLWIHVNACDHVYTKIINLTVTWKRLMSLNWDLQLICTGSSVCIPLVLELLTNIIYANEDHLA